MTSSITKKLGSLALIASIAAAILAGTTATTARAQTAQAPDSGDALLNVLVSKGVLTSQEAGKVAGASSSRQGEQDAPPTVANTAAAAPVFKFFPALTSLAFSGDIRVRYEYKQASTLATETTPRDNYDMNRYRYRLRLGVSGTAAGGWFFNARLEGGNNNRSSNITMGSYSTGNGTGLTGGKGASNTIYVGHANLGWTGQGFTFTAGRMANPFVYTQFFMWSDDLNVEGLAQQWKHDFGGFSLFANLAQLIYVSNGGMVNAIGDASRGVATTFLFGTQIGGRVKLNDGRMHLQIAPAYYGYSNDARSLMRPLPVDPANPNSPNFPNLQTAGLQILSVPVELGLPPVSIAAKKIPARIFGDFAVNFGAGTRARVANFPDKKNQNTAWQLGAAIGQARNKGDWEVRGFYQSTGAFALDPNLLDLSQFDARTNMKGWTATTAYALTNSVSVRLSYFNGRRKDASLPTYGAADVNTAYIGIYNALQTDLGIRF